MRSIASYHREFESNNTIIVNGVKMTIKEFKDMHKQPTKTTKKQISTKTIRLLPNEIKAMLKQVKVLKSLVAYYNNGYKQWGRIANTIMTHRDIKTPFTQVVIKAKQAERLVKKIDTIAKKNDYDVFQFINQLQMRLEELTEQLTMLVNGIANSHVTKQYKDHECINGEGRRLGLRILCLRSHKAIDELEVICQRLWNMQEDGVDIFEYDAENGRRK